MRSVRAAVLPSASERYDASQERQFRLALEQELQRLSAQAAEASGPGRPNGLVVNYPSQPALVEETTQTLTGIAGIGVTEVWAYQVLLPLDTDITDPSAYAEENLLGVQFITPGRDGSFSITYDTPPEDSRVWYRVRGYDGAQSGPPADGYVGYVTPPEAVPGSAFLVFDGDGDLAYATGHPSEAEAYLVLDGNELAFADATDMSVRTVSAGGQITVVEL